jgi:hypothetical protein
VFCPVLILVLGFVLKPMKATKWENQLKFKSVQSSRFPVNDVTSGNLDDVTRIFMTSKDLAIRLLC